MQREPEERVSDKVNNPDLGKDKSNNNDELVIEVRQYHTLLDILDNPRHVYTIICMLALFTLTIFMGLAFTTIAIKRFYPYNEIRTNVFGATTMENEDMELTYWLFNPAELWANSGIEVEEGDIVTIRSSGQINTSIHHLVNNAQYNIPPRYRWASTDGFSRGVSTRTKYRIYPEREPDALIMQIKEAEQHGDRYMRPDLFDETGDSDYDRYYYIGKEYTSMRIRQRGIMHFAVNDIVLTRPCIDTMLSENEWLIGRCEGGEQNLDLWRELYEAICAPTKPKRDSSEESAWRRVKKMLNITTEDTKHSDELTGDESLIEKYRFYVCRVVEQFQTLVDECIESSKSGNEKRYFEAYNKIALCMDIYAKYYGEGGSLDPVNNSWRKANNKQYYFGGNPVALPQKENWREYHKVASNSINTSDELTKNCFPFYNEMTNYRATDYKNVWYDDNVGSILIVVERHKK